MTFIYFSWHYENLLHLSSRVGSNISLLCPSSLYSYEICFTFIYLFKTPINQAELNCILIFRVQY